MGVGVCVGTLLIVVLSSARAMVSGNSSLATVLPEPEGIQTLVADAQHVYVAYGDTPVGHVAAIDTGSGRVAWTAPSVRSTSLLAASGGVVWAASDLNDGLIAQAASTGLVLRRFVAPAGGVWDAVGSRAGIAYASSRRSSPTATPYLSTITAGTIHSVPIHMPPPALCYSAIVVSRALILQCVYGSRSTVELVHIDPRTGRQLATGALTRQSGVVLVQLDGSLYAQSMSAAGRYDYIERFDARTLRRISISHALHLDQGIAADSTGLYSAKAGRNGPELVQINPSTLTIDKSVPITGGRYDFFLTANSSDVFAITSPPGQVAQSLVHAN